MILRASKTLELSTDKIGNNQEAAESCRSHGDQKNSTFTDSMGDDIMIQENPCGGLMSLSPKKDFRIKSKPFNSLNTALMNFSGGKALSDSKSEAKSNENSPLNIKESPKNQQSPSFKRKSKFSGEPDVGLIFQEKQKNPKIPTPKNDQMKKSVELFANEKPKVKKIVAISPICNSSNASMLASLKEKEKRFSVEESKRTENIRLDKETLRDLNRYTDKNFIKSIQASFRKLEIIEKINEDNFNNVGEKLNLTVCSQSPRKRHSTKDETNFLTPDNNSSSKKFLPLISPDHSPKKSSKVARNAHLPKNY